MKTVAFKYLTLLVVFTTVLLVGCVEDAAYTAEEEDLMLHFPPPQIAVDIETRAIADGSAVDHLTVVAIDNTGFGRVFEMTWEEARTEGVNFTAITGRTYDILFWAHHKGTYAVDDKGIVTVDYAAHVALTFADIENLDAFSHVIRGLNPRTTTTGAVTLTRAVAQLNLADHGDAAPAEGNTAALAVVQATTRYNAIYGSTVESAVEPITFTFDTFAGETLDANGTVNHLLASAYLLPANPAFVGYTTTAGGGVLRHSDPTTRIQLKAGSRVNIIGHLLTAPENSEGSETPETPDNSETTN